MACEVADASDCERTITQEMVAAATRLYRGDFFPGWRVSNAALEKLSEDLRDDWRQESCLLRAVVVNDLYGTNVYAIVPMAKHISRIMSKNPARDVSLVGQIAKHADTSKTHISFASKFCHFFVSEKHFPIFDDRACKGLRHFLGDKYRFTKDKPYEVFVANMERARDENPINASSREFDRFLWIVGSWIHFQSNQQVNGELKNLFNKRPRILGTLLPRCLHYGCTFGAAGCPAAP
jgi:hypothetical protein